MRLDLYTNPITRLLLWIGLVRIRRRDLSIAELSPANRKLSLPFGIWPRWCWRHILLHEPFIVLFRNSPHVIKWEKGRLLPRRFGDSGSECSSSVTAGRVKGAYEQVRAHVRVWETTLCALA